MFTLKVFFLLVLALAANGSDLQSGLDIMACAKAAITVGVPELGIPSHEPYVSLKTELNLDEDFGIAEGIVNITNMTWAGLARWNLTAVQLSTDSAPFAVFDFELYWDWMELAGHYRFEEKAVFIDEVQTGLFAIEFNKTSWSGSINVTKAGERPSQKNGTVDYVQIDWYVDTVGVSILIVIMRQGRKVGYYCRGPLKTEKRSFEFFNGPETLIRFSTVAHIRQVNITGLNSAVDATVEATLKTTIKTALNYNLIGNAVGDFVKMRLKTIWWDTGRVWDLVIWCQNNNITAVN